MSTFNVIKLDKRHHGNQAYKYAIDCNVVSVHTNFGVRITNYRTYRDWLIDTYGHSCELNLLHHLNSDYPIWSWKYEHSPTTLKLFIKDDTILSNFLLKFSS